MNIALCYDTVDPAKGGCETYIGDLARRLIRDGHAVHLYARKCKPEALPLGITFHPVSVGPSLRMTRPWQFAAACDRILRRIRHDVTVGFVKTWHPDVLIAQSGLHAASMEYGLRKYRKSWLRSLVRLSRRISPTQWSFAALERKQYLHGRQPLVVVPSRMVQRHLCDYYDYPPARIRVIANAIDPARFAEGDRLRLRTMLRQRLGIGSNESVALFVGHNYRLKGLDPLLEAVADAPTKTLHLLICGGRDDGRYRRWVRRRGLCDRVHCLGFYPDVRACYFAADFLAHPTYYDPCSLVVLEALHCGLPVITTRCNGASELLNAPHDSTIVDRPDDVAALRQALVDWCDRDRCQAGSRAARQTARRWTFEDHYQQLLGVFVEAAARKRAA